LPHELVIVILHTPGKSSSKPLCRKNSTRTPQWGPGTEGGRGP